MSLLSDERGSALKTSCLLRVDTSLFREHMLFAVAQETLLLVEVPGSHLGKTTPYILRFTARVRGGRAGKDFLPFMAHLAQR